MSEEKPPGEPDEPTSPYGAAPGGPPAGSPAPPAGYPAYPPGVPPAGYPAYPPGVQGTARPSDRWKIWVGIACALPVLFVTGAVAGLLSGVRAGGSVAGLVGLAAFVGPIVMLFFDATRKFALGLIIGYAVLFILAAGACIALLSAYN